MTDEKQELYLEFVYLQNRLIDLGNLEQYPIPMTYKTDVNPTGHVVPQNVYHMDKVHKISLKDETPNLPVKEDGMSDRYHSELCDDEWKRIQAARTQNNIVRKRVEHYVKEGVIKVVNDPFKRRTEPETTATAAKSPASEAGDKPKRGSRTTE